MRKFLGGILIVFMLGSCTDAGMVSGKYSGKFFYSNAGDTVLYQDTMTASIAVTEINSSTVQLNITTSQSQTFINIAALNKNADQAYDLMDSDPIMSYSLLGYYYEGFLSFSYHSDPYLDYKFEGQKN